MTRYVALMRGINIGGNTSLPMADLRRVFDNLGHQDVRTYIQSGNVVFGADSSDEDAVLAGIRRGLSADLGRDLPVVLRSAEDLDAVIDGNPFPGQADFTKLLVTFLDADPGDKQDALASPKGETGVLKQVGREVYVHVPDGYGRSKLTNAFVEKKTGVAGTTRNWKTVLKLRELLG
ncbi:uncharacterized protein (DUF1697 family) [Saccharothrix tamanrassetensis]|uniref:Uncharacterized protein (DUF1697 family) n=1 Tax=Saccharothrix tamanrassetensis TaxID=1051531 RepID=A0A841CCN6_9PSEU|nr:DUF1697 domain-containing protein [Saccharothrix tamanrassetensis]MBB5953775.1 uncharacterized protein (DUF1697 family) [Saccharothrix tamanrassetensis]